jgi:hypothetical protein
MPSKYAMEICSKRHSTQGENTNWQALRDWACGCAVVYCANLTQPNNLTLATLLRKHILS